MNYQKVVQPGKIVTIIFDSPSTRPLYIRIDDKNIFCEEEVVTISSRTQLAKAILNHQLGEEVKFKSSEGLLQIKILDIL